MASKSKNLIVQDGEPTDVDGIPQRYAVSPIRALLPDKGARKKSPHEHIPTEKSRKGVLSFRPRRAPMGYYLNLCHIAHAFGGFNLYSQNTT